MNQKFEKYMLLLCVAGAVLSLYLYYVDIVNISAICPTDGCAKVAASEYSRFIGVPVSLWGFIYYVGFASLFMFKDLIEIVQKNLKTLVTLALTVGIGFTVYLRFVEFFFIKAICIWCWGSVLVMVLLTITYILSLKRNVQDQSN